MINKWLAIVAILLGSIWIIGYENLLMWWPVNSSIKNEADRSFKRTVDSADGRRLALVIGNSAYNAMPNDLQPLRNPVNDADDITQTLKKLDFQVMLLKDASLEKMEDSIYEFSQQLQHDDAALFYYSGHGMQVKGENYLIPVDAKFEREDQIDRKSIRASQVLEKIADARTKLVFLDACRNNPFLSRGKKGSVRGGLTKMSSPSGTLLVYATDPDNFAEDGRGRNGTFTKHLLNAITTTDVDVEIMLRQVRNGVKKETAGKQTPWQASSLEGAFYFAITTNTVISTTTTVTAIPVPTTAVDNARLNELENKRKAEEARLAELEQQRKEAEAAARLAEIENKRKVEEARLAELKQQQRDAETTNLIHGRYRDHGDGTVTDIVTNIRWQRCAVGEIWNGNISTCDGKAIKYKWDDLPKLNKGGWHVPTIDELKTLIYCSNTQKFGDECQGDFKKPAIDQEAFPSKALSFWSSASHAYVSYDAWYVVLYSGYAYGDNKDLAFQVRLARAGQ